ncbi:MAG: VOC family protein [Chloroflexota bacterium]
MTIEEKKLVSTGFQITVDCRDPHRQAAFWAAALGYEIEDHSALIESLLRAGAATDADIVEIEGRKAWREAAAINDPSRERSDPGARMLFHAVPEGKTAKNRLHLDLHRGHERDGIVEGLVGLGATVLGHYKERGSEWAALRDPEGNEFCVQ